MVEENKGLLALGFKEGQRLPFVEIDHKVGEKGELLWRVRSALDVFLDGTYEIRSYLWRKRDRNLMAIFRGWNLLARALMGFPIRSFRGGWPIEPLPAPYQTNQIPTEYEEAPRQIQAAVLYGAARYLGIY